MIGLDGQQAIWQVLLISDINDEETYYVDATLFSEQRVIKGTNVLAEKVTIYSLVNSDEELSSFITP